MRQVTRRHSHYLVRYECDLKLQVRTAGFFNTGEKVSEKIFKSIIFITFNFYYHE